jgi:hypothetical protein
VSAIGKKLPDGLAHLTHSPTSVLSKIWSSPILGRVSGLSGASGEAAEGSAVGLSTPVRS